VDAGYPLFESVDNTHLSADVAETVQGWADELIATSGAPVESWPFRVRTDSPPFPGEFGKGDLCVLKVAGDDFIPDGEYTREIASLSGSEDPDWITVTTVEARLE
jgi:hypothetical protein